MHSFKELVQIFEQKIETDFPLPQEPANLYEPCRYLLNLGGKRVRPALCVMGNELFGEISDEAWHAGWGIELFHNFTLVHDDIMDEAPLRRGNQTIHTKYNLTAGILSGDVLCILAYEQLAHVGTALPQVLRLFNKTAIEVCEGQQLDMDFEQRSDVTIDEYINMIALKTSVLLACSLKVGALIAGADSKEADKIYEFGKNVGIAFQLQDDYLDAFGETDKLGKQNGGDIKANKKTYLLLKAQMSATDAQQVAIDELLTTSSDDKVTKMLELYRQTGSDKACRDIANEYSEKAFKCLADINVSDERKQPLRDLANYLLQRDK